MRAQSRSLASAQLSWSVFCLPRRLIIWKYKVLSWMMSLSWCLLYLVLEGEGGLVSAQTVRVHYVPWKLASLACWDLISQEYKQSQRHVYWFPITGPLISRLAIVRGSFFGCKWLSRGFSPERKKAINCARETVKEIKRERDANNLNASVSSSVYVFVHVRMYVCITACLQAPVSSNHKNQSQCFEKRL